MIASARLHLRYDSTLGREWQPNVAARGWASRQEDQYHREGEKTSRLKMGARGVGGAGAAAAAAAAAMRDKDYKGGGDGDGGGRRSGGGWRELRKCQFAVPVSPGIAIVIR